MPTSFNALNDFLLCGMLQSPSPSTTTTARRSARVQRISNANYNTPTQPSSRRKVVKLIRKFNKAPTRQWAQVLRPPQPAAHFMTLTWVPLEGVTPEEKITYANANRKRPAMKRKEGFRWKVTISVNNGSEGDVNESTSV